MKGTFNVLGAVFLAGTMWLTLGRSGQAAVETQPAVISVSGEAEVKVVPDEVVITLGVETYHHELSVAKGRNDRIVENTIAEARQAGVPAKNIKTDYLGLEPNYSDDYFEYVVEGFWVRRTITITLDDISRFEALLTAITESGATNVHGIEFRTTELRKYRDQARELALLAAREKATAMSAALGESLGAVRSIYEDYAGWYSWYSYGWWGSRYSSMMQNVVQNAGGAPQEVEGSFAPGQISVTARVSVSFELAP